MLRSLEPIYARWLQNPSSVNSSFIPFFQAIKEGHPDPESVLPPVQVWRGDTGIPSSTASVESSDVQTEVENALRLSNLMHAYRVHGHSKADLDPLKFAKISRSPHYSDFGFSEKDLSSEITTFKSAYSHGANRVKSTIGEVIDRMEHAYCGTYTCQYMHCVSDAERYWIMTKFETTKPTFTAEQKRTLFTRLSRARGFEDYLAKKMGTTKRFGIEGCETLPLAFETAIEHGTQHGIREIGIGMSHRGRLTTLAWTLNLPLQIIMNLFHDVRDVEGGTEDFFTRVDWDVKYHVGYRTTRHVWCEELDETVPVNISLAANPSHLEAVNPVVTGKIRADIEFNGLQPTEALPILVHGDAAFVGQGIVAETLQLSNIDGYATFGTLHFVVNNQIGFTTLPEDSRTSRYSSDIAKSIGAPIFMVNADDPEAVSHVTALAIEYRQKFHKDVVVELIGYRLHGHNETDEPSFTQPMMYKTIKKMVPAHQQYSDKLIASGELDKKKKKKIEKIALAEMNEAWANRKTPLTTHIEEWLEARWGKFFGFQTPHGEYVEPTTSISEETVQRVGDALTYIPPGFVPHRVIDHKLQQKREMFKTGKDFDWGTGEALAFGSLLTEGIFVRLSGQDAQRGTFSHRHATLHCQETGRTWTNLNHIDGVHYTPRPENMRFTKFRKFKSADYDGVRERLDFPEKNQPQNDLLPEPKNHFLYEENLEIPPPGEGNHCNSLGHDAVVGLSSPDTNTKSVVRFDVHNSPLSEAAVLGFEHGFSLENPDALVMFEGQFGDFLNTAQSIIDTFIAAGESKWLRQSGMVMLLPHGYEGQGAEHSSARIERFLQLHNQQIHQDIIDGQPKTTAQSEHASNMRLYQPTTPANIFHVLRSQLFQEYYNTKTNKVVKYRKPLIIFSPKSLLNHRLVKSSLEDFTQGELMKIIPEGAHIEQPGIKPKESVRKVIWCSGKVFYDLFEHRAKEEIDDIHIIRIEQLAPLPIDEIAELANSYPEGTRHCWVQDEPANMGPWMFIKLRWNNWVSAPKVKYVEYGGRLCASSPATGSPSQHNLEVQHVLKLAFD